ncbi:hypothetical protein [Parvularcula sp. IMCC14364]|uniref:hypothetical protein n=1 Tax=Parvularcula sp. IMCC14364 TaxID=3067902 RepID=UPI0027416727|nr:hypothetical protein [Parvularcula sp. IMCC14364]
MPDFSDPLFFWSLAILLSIIAFILIGGCWMTIVPSASRAELSGATGPDTDNATLSLSEDATARTVFAAPPLAEQVAAQTAEPLYLRRTQPSRVPDLP